MTLDDDGFATIVIIVLAGIVIIGAAWDLFRGRR